MAADINTCSAESTETTKKKNPRASLQKLVRIKPMVVDDEAVYLGPAESTVCCTQLLLLLLLLHAKLGASRLAGSDGSIEGNPSSISTFNPKKYVRSD